MYNLQKVLDASTLVDLANVVSKLVYLSTLKVLNGHLWLHRI